MKVLFLDVDGVLNHEAAFHERSGIHVLDPFCVKRVIRVCDRVGARIVVSSTWRGSPESMEKLLKAFGDRIIGVTPFIHPGTRPRSDEIGAWITQHSAIPLECVAVDDDSDAAGIAWRFVQTDFERGGFTEEKAEEVLAAFGAPQGERKDG